MLKYENLPEVNSERWLSLEDLECEEWRDISGFELKLQISCYGRVKCKGYTYIHPRGGLTRRKPQMYRLKMDDRGYLRTAFYLNGKRYSFQVHRLVAMAFISNPQNLPIINHKDENPSNNCVYNIEWCTSKYNSNYGTIKEKQKNVRIEHNYVKPVVLYDYEGKVIKEYRTIKEAAIDNKTTITTISHCCDGTTESARGLHFRYKGEKYEKRKIKRIRLFFKVYKDSKLIIETDECKKMCKCLGIDYVKFLNALHSKEVFDDIKDYKICVTSSIGKSFEIINGIKKL